MKRLLTVLLFLLSFNLLAQKKYQHILITNDDGIEDIDRLLALARAVANQAEKVSVIVSSVDRSGHSNFSAIGKGQSVLEVTCEYVEQNIGVYSIPDNPADCVLLGLGGLFDETPDLVLSGINSGSNIGRGWFASGTIGAVRTAAFLGVKAVAFSGFDDDQEESYKEIPNWISQFIDSELIEKMQNGDYITVGIPKISLDKIKGVKISDRATHFDRPDAIRFKKVFGDSPYEDENTTIWAVSKYGIDREMRDEILIEEGYIVITPMSVNENAPKLLKKMGGLKLPAFELGSMD